MNYNYIKSTSKSKYINGYVVKGDYAELHITDNKIDKVIIIDTQDIDKCLDRFWCVAMTGRIGYKREQVYCTYNGIRTPLTRYLKDIRREDKIIFKNCNYLDYRKNNLVVVSRHGKITKDFPKENKSLPIGIYPIFNELGRLTGYKVEDGVLEEKKTLCFSLANYSTLENCLYNAILYRIKTLNNSIELNSDIKLLA